MRQKTETLPMYLALGLAALAAVMSGFQQRPDIDIDATVLYVLTASANALDMPQPDPEKLEQFTSP